MTMPLALVDHYLANYTNTTLDDHCDLSLIEKEKEKEENRRIGR